MCSSPLKAAGQAEGRLTLSFPFSILYTSLSLCHNSARTTTGPSFLISARIRPKRDSWLPHEQKCVGERMRLCVALSVVESLYGWLKPLPSHSTWLVLAHEWYGIVRPLSIPALLNGFDHWFRFGYTVLVESVPHPPLWTPWFPWLTCLEKAVEMSCRPSHGPDRTFILIDYIKRQKNDSGWIKTT